MPGRIIRQSDRFFALQFDLPQSIERDLLIRKLFTRGVKASAEVDSKSAATIAILGSARPFADTPCRLPKGAYNTKP